MAFNINKDELTHILLNISTEASYALKQVSRMLNRAVEDVEANNHFWMSRAKELFNMNEDEFKAIEQNPKPRNWRKIHADFDQTLLKYDDQYVDTIKLLLADQSFPQSKGEKVNLDAIDPSTDDNYLIRNASQYGHTEVVKMLLADDRVDPSTNLNCVLRGASL